MLGGKPARVLTAEFIILTDLIVVATVFLSLAFRFNVDRFEMSPVVIAVAGLTVVLLRAVALTAVSGGLKAIASVVMLAFAQLLDWIVAVAGNDSAPYPFTVSVRSRARRLTVGRGAVINQRNDYWFSLLAVGFVGQSLIVVGTGGMADSPFAQFLIATFILGQFRSRGRTIWFLFIIGVTVAIGTHITYLLAFDDGSVAWLDNRFQARYYIAPGFIVAFASTLIYWVSRLGEQSAPSAPTPTSPPATITSGELP